MIKIKRMLSLLTITIIATTLFSCRKNLVAGPVNLKYDYKTYTLHWDEVSNASGYVLDINGMLYESIDAEYSFKDAEKGLYKVKIKAIFKNQESIFSNTLSFVVSEHINLLVYSDGSFLYWEEIDNATYEISYLDNLSLKTITTLQNKFTIPEILKEGLNNVTLKVFVDDELLSKQNILLDYNIIRVYKNSPYILRIYDASDVYINGRKVYGVTIREDNIRISSNLIYNYIGETYISVSGEENILKRFLILPEPFELISFYIQPYMGDDVKFEFLFKNYEIKEITGLDFGSDYRIEALKNLVINKSFIDNYRSNNPFASKIELKVTLESCGITEQLHLEIELN